MKKISVLIILVLLSSLASSNEIKQVASNLLSQLKKRIAPANSAKSEIEILLKKLRPAAGFKVSALRGRIHLLTS